MGSWLAAVFLLWSGECVCVCGGGGGEGLQNAKLFITITGEVEKSFFWFS
jgi:hypothetical protein